MMTDLNVPQIKSEDLDKTKNWYSLWMHIFGYLCRQEKRHRKLDTYHFLFAGKLKHSLPWETQLSVVLLL